MQTPQILILSEASEPFEWDENGHAVKAVKTICEKWVENPQHSFIYVDGLNEWLRKVPEGFRLQWFLLICRTLLYTIRRHAMNNVAEVFLEAGPVKRLCSMDMLLGLRANQEYVKWLLARVKQRMPTDHKVCVYVVEEVFLKELEKQLSC